MGLFSFLDKNKQANDEENNPPVKARRTRRSESSEAQEPLDPALPEKRRARRRLIGATALVLAAIIGLPMIFDSEPKPFSDEIAIQIPARDAPATRQSAPSLPPLELSPPTNRVVEKPSAPIAPAAPVAVPKIDTPAPVVKNNVAEPVQAEKEVKKEVAPKESSKEKTKEIAKEKTNDKSKDKSKDKASNKTDSAKQSDSKNTKSNRDLPIRYVLQVAAVENKAKADDMQEKLKKAGIKSYTQKISTNAGDRIRIRVGPFVNKEEAEKMRTRLRKLGLNGSLQPV
ncbi:MAG: DedD protein [Pseudomonadota bacterium]|jgi:DedD protein